MAFSEIRGGSAFGQTGVFCGLLMRSVVLGHKASVWPPRQLRNFCDFQKSHKIRWDQVLVSEDHGITSETIEDASLAKRGAVSKK